MKLRFGEWKQIVRNHRGTPMLQWMRRHTVLLASALLLWAVVAPQEVQGQLPSPCCAILATGLGTINSSLINVIGSGLSTINTVMPGAWLQTPANTRLIRPPLFCPIESSSRTRRRAPAHDG